VIDLDTCKCNDKQPGLICFACWWRGVRPADRLGEPTGPAICPVPEVVPVVAIDEKLLRYKAAGILDCTCDQRRDGKNGRKDCPRHKEFYGTATR